MMQITLNGEQREIADATTLATLIDSMGMTGQRIAIEVNETLVPRSQHDQHLLTEGDTIEIVRAIGGG